MAKGKFLILKKTCLKIICLFRRVFLTLSSFSWRVSRTHKKVPLCTSCRLISQILYRKTDPSSYTYDRRVSEIIFTCSYDWYRERSIYTGGGCWERMNLGLCALSNHQQRMYNVYCKWNYCSGQLKFTLHNIMSCNVQNVFFCCLTFPLIDGAVMTLAQLHSGPNQLKKCFRLLTLALNFGH